MATTRFADHLLTGIHSARPSASAVPAGTLYSCTTHGLVYQSDGSSTWSTWATLGGTGGVAADTIWDTKGDLAVATGADAASKLAVGANNTVLTADSTQTTGLKWAAAGGGGAWTLLSTTTRATDGTIDVSSISGSYNDLILMAILRGTDAGATDTVKLQLNNDTGANYGSQKLNGNTATASATESNSGNQISAGIMPAAGATASCFWFAEILIPGYASTTWNKIVIVKFGYGTGITTGLRVVADVTGFWNSTAAVNRVTFSGFSTANLLTGSTLRIYGRT